MNQTRYPTTEERIIPPLYIPRRLYKLMKELAEMEPGRYLLTVTFHDGKDAEPDCTVLCLGKVRNQR